MFVQDIYIKRAKWLVTVYHAVDDLWAEEILGTLIQNGCRGEDLKNASDLLWGGMRNNGITYSNLSKRRSVMVIGTTTCGEEYWNTLDHEKLHLLQDISIADKIDPYGEDISYISGEFIRDVYKKAKSLLCDCCRGKHQ